MWRPSPRAAGPLAVAGAVCLLSAMVPLEVWPAPHPGDSYVFDPPTFSGVWAERVAVPVLTVGANALVLVSLYALYRRDSTAMPGWQRGSAIVTLFGTAVWLFGSYLVTSAGPNDFVVGGFGALVAVLALVVTVPGLVAWGIGYLQTGKARLGAALVGAPLLTVLYLAVSLSGVDFDPVGGLALTAPTAVMVLLVGYDLWVDTSPPVGGQRAES